MRKIAAALLVGDQVELAAAEAGLGVLEAVELVGRRAQALGQQAPVVDRQRELAAAAGRHRRALGADDVAEVEVDQQRVGLLAEQVLAGVQLDLAAAVAEVEEAGLAVAAAGDDPPGDPVARLGLDPRRQPLVRGPHLGDVLAPGELVRERLDPRLADPLQLLPPVREDVGESAGLLLRVGSLIEARAYRRSGLLDLGDFQFFLRPARDLDRDDVVALVPDQRFADRRLVGELVLERVRLGRADDLEFLRVAGFLVFDVDDRAEADLVGADRLLVDHRGRGAAAPRAGRSAPRAAPVRSWRRRIRRSRRCRRIRAPP